WQPRHELPALRPGRQRDHDARRPADGVRSLDDHGDDPAALRRGEPAFGASPRAAPRRDRGSRRAIMRARARNTAWTSVAPNATLGGNRPRFLGDARPRAGALEVSLDTQFNPPGAHP